MRDLGRALSKRTRALMMVGDLSQPRGGFMASMHRSHQNGMDVDIWFRLAGSVRSAHEVTAAGCASYGLGEDTMPTSTSGSSVPEVAPAAGNNLPPFPHRRRLRSVTRLVVQRGGKDTLKETKEEDRTTHTSRLQGTAFQTLSNVSRITFVRLVRFPKRPLQGGFFHRCRLHRKGNRLKNREAGQQIVQLVSILVLDRRR